MLHLLLVYLLWGSSFAAIKVLLEGGMTANALAFWRLLFSSVPFLLFSITQKGRRNILRHLGIGCLMWGFGHLFLVWGEERVDSSLAALIYAIVPVLGVLFEILAKQKQLSKKIVFSFLFSTLGLFWMSYPQISSAPTSGKHLLLVVIAAVSWAYGSFVSQNGERDEENLAFSLGIQQLAGMLLALIFALASKENLALKSSSGGVLAYLVLGPTMLAYYSYFQVMKKFGLNIALSFAYVNPLVATLLGVFFMHESFSSGLFMGGFFIIVGIMLSFYAPSTRRSVAPT